MSAKIQVQDPNSNDFPWARVSNIALVAAIVAIICAYQRFATFHNETFDLAFYHRLLWGIGRGDYYQPLTNSHAFGLHASLVLWPLSWIARVIPAVPLMLVVQAVSLMAAAIPLARIAARHLRTPWAADATVILYLLYPTVFTAASYEFHPSALAMFPLAYALDAWDRGEARSALIALTLAAFCREDVALVTALTAGLWAINAPRTQRKTPALFSLCAFVYFAIYQFLIAPKYLPVNGSMSLHFGALGSTPFAIVKTVIAHPIATLGMIATPGKWLYLPRLLAPLAFLPLLAPRWLLPALAPLAINFLSAWPTAIQPRSHYSLLIVPFLFVAAIYGAGVVIDAKHPLGGPMVRPTGRKMLLITTIALLIASLGSQYRSGATPLSRHWNYQHFVTDSRTLSLRELTPQIRPDGMVVAPDELLAHVANRPIIQRLDHWTRATDDLVLRLGHRRRFALSQDGWRSAEEVLVRNILAGDRYGLVLVSGDYALLRRGVSSRWYATDRYVQFQPDSWTTARHLDIDDSVAIASWRIEPLTASASKVTLWLVSKQAWPQDLGLELGWGRLSPHGDRLDPAEIAAFVPFDGLFNPSHVHVGEISRTSITLPTNEATLMRDGLYFGTRRLDGSRLHALSAHWVRMNP